MSQNWDSQQTELLKKPLEPRQNKTEKNECATMER